MLLENQTILEGRVHSLAVEGHDGVSRVPKKDRTLTAVPAVAGYGHEASDRVLTAVVHECRHEIDGIGIDAANEFSGVLAGIQRLETRAITFPWPEQGAREALVRVGKRDHHRGASRPDMQGIGIDRIVAGRCGWDDQFLVAMGDERLAESESAPIRRSLHGTSYDRKGAVGTHDEIRLYSTRFVVMGMLDRDLPRIEVDIRDRLLEVERDVLMLRRTLEKKQIQVATRDRVDRFAGIGAVRVEALVPLGRMDDPATHRNGHRLHDLFTQSDLAKRLEPPA